MAAAQTLEGHEVLISAACLSASAPDAKCCFSRSREGAGPVLGVWDLTPSTAPEGHQQTAHPAWNGGSERERTVQGEYGGLSSHPPGLPMGRRSVSEPFYLKGFLRAQCFPGSLKAWTHWDQDAPSDMR